MVLCLVFAPKSDGTTGEVDHFFRDLIEFGFDRIHFSMDDTKMLISFELFVCVSMPDARLLGHLPRSSDMVT
jgi:hypothetical protein